MPEYLAPGVFVEETSFRSKAIEGVSTSTAGFVGATRFGPVKFPPAAVGGLHEFERIYGDGGQLEFTDAGRMHNYLWHAVRAFFAEGGKRLYIARAFLPAGGGRDGIARAVVPVTGGAKAIVVRGRFPGTAGNMRVRFMVNIGANILGRLADKATVSGVQPSDIVWIEAASASAAAPSPCEPGSGDFFLAAWDETELTWRFGKSRAKTQADVRLNAPGGGAPAVAVLDPARGASVRIVDLTVMAMRTDGWNFMWTRVPPDPAHHRAGTPDSLFAQFPAAPCDPVEARTVPLVITAGDGIATGLDVLDALFAARPTLRTAVVDAGSADADRSVDVLLSGGEDGARPTAVEFAGTDDPSTAARTGLKALESIGEVSIVAAPGATVGFNTTHKTDVTAIVGHLIAHAERSRDRVAVIDCGDDLTVTEVRAMRARFDSKCAALYYPWIRVSDPISHQQINLPPSGFVCGIFARSDTERGVHKAPANVTVKLAIGLETLLDDGQREILNSEGINCFRSGPQQRVLLWGARTISSDSDWKYVNLRRYLAYLEQSIYDGTRWAVFEPNGDALWANLRRSVEDFLASEWKAGALVGETPEKAFFVRCDRAAMTQCDLDHGRLVCEIGVAPLRPAEFVIFRIGQWTADAKRAQKV